MSEDQSASTAEASQAKPSAVELAKIASNYLVGDIPKELVDGAPGFGKASVQLLKNHGTYQQDDRETRKKSADGKKSERQISFMIRTCVPGGKLSAPQLLSAIDMGDELGNGTIRLTTRQAIQHHGVVKGELKTFMQRVHANHLSTLAACGDVERNIMCCPAPIKNNPVYDEMQAKVDELAKHLAPRTRAYYEIWLTDPDTGEKTLAAGGEKAAEVEPIYGPTYLPRKFKTAFALPGRQLRRRLRQRPRLSSRSRERKDHWLQRAHRRRHGRDPECREDLSRARQAARIRAAGGRAWHRRGGREGAAGFRESLRPQGGPAQVHDPHDGA
jgi:sulfite reductase (ferredoxin)